MGILGVENAVKEKNVKRPGTPHKFFDLTRDHRVSTIVANPCTLRCNVQARSRIFHGMLP